MIDVENLRRDLKKFANPQKGKDLQRFFKTGKGEYAEGDVFLGIMVPQSRKIAMKYRDLNLTSVEELLRSKFHEERLIALLILVLKFSPQDYHSNVLENVGMKKRVFDFYLENTKYINNWDLVDLSAPKIVGAYFLARQSRILDEQRLGSARSLNGSSEPSGNTSLIYEKSSNSPAVNDPSKVSMELVKRPFCEGFRPIDILLTLAKSKNIWERRIAVLATFQFIKYGRFEDSLKLAEILLKDQHDLIHKAVGWMLREIGKRDLQTEIKFLDKYSTKMPRTMLRYAIERFPEKLRQTYLKKI